jgi:hypothetical protein
MIVDILIKSLVKGKHQICMTQLGMYLVIAYFVFPSLVNTTL